MFRTRFPLLTTVFVAALSFSAHAEETPCTELFLSPEEIRLVDAYEKILWEHSRHVSLVAFTDEIAHALETHSYYGFAKSGESEAEKFLGKIEAFSSEPRLSLEIRKYLERIFAETSERLKASDTAVEAKKMAKRYSLHFEGATDLRDPMIEGAFASVSGSPYQSKDIFLWSAETGKIETRLRGHNKAISNIRVSADRKGAVTTGRDNRLIVWDIPTAKPRFTIGPVSGEIYDHMNHLEVDAAFTQALTGDGRGNIALWNLQTGEAIWKIQGHSGGITRVVPDPTFERAVSISENEIKLWDLRTGTLIFKSKDGQGRFSRVAVDWRSNRAITGSGDGRVAFWDFGSKRRIESRKIYETIPGQGPNSVNVLEVSSDGKTALTASVHHEIDIWDLEKRTSRRIHGPSPNLGPDLAIRSDFKKIVYEDPVSRRIEVIDTETGKVDVHFDRHQGEITAIALSPDEKHVFTGDTEGYAYLWSAETGELELEFPKFSSWVYFGGFDAEMKRLVTGTRQGPAILWDLEALDAGY